MGVPGVEAALRSRPCPRMLTAGPPRLLGGGDGLAPRLAGAASVALTVERCLALSNPSSTPSEPPRSWWRPVEAVLTLLSHVPCLALPRLLVLVGIKLNLNSLLSLRLGWRLLGGRHALLLLCPRLALALAMWSLRRLKPIQFKTKICL